MNQMHGSYDISNDDMRYVLSTFVVTPVRWIDDFGWRKLSRNEIVGSTNYYRALGKYMGIKQIPETFEAFERFLDDYEREHFLFDEGGRAVADSTLALLCTFPPNNLAPAALIKRFSWALMDDPLLDAFAYRRPSRLARTLSRAALKARARLVRFYPVRTSPSSPATSPTSAATRPGTKWRNWAPSPEPAPCSTPTVRSRGKTPHPEPLWTPDRRNAVCSNYSRTHGE